MSALPDAQREREHSLADRDRGQHLVGEVHGRIRHAPAAARGTEAAALAGKGHELVTPALRTVDARKASGQDSAIEEAVQLAADEVR